jgi:hypothetical protein
LYRHLLPSLQTAEGEELALPGPGTSIDLAYLPLSKDTKEVRPFFPEWSADDLASASEAARNLIRTLRAEGWVVFDREKTPRAARGELAALLGKGALPENGEAG